MKNRPSNPNPPWRPPRRSPDVFDEKNPIEVVLLLVLLPVGVERRDAPLSPLRILVDEEEEVGFVALENNVLSNDEVVVKGDWERLCGIELK